jgi:hypothetical protein
MDNDVEDLDLTFNVDGVNLIEDGENVLVTEDN